MIKLLDAPRTQIFLSRVRSINRRNANSEDFHSAYKKYILVIEDGPAGQIFSNRIPLHPFVTHYPKAFASNPNRTWYSRNPNARWIHRLQRRQTPDYLSQILFNPQPASVVAVGAEMHANPEVHKEHPGLFARVFDWCEQNGVFPIYCAWRDSLHAMLWHRHQNLFEANKSTVLFKNSFPVYIPPKEFRVYAQNRASYHQQICRFLLRAGGEVCWIEDLLDPRGRINRSLDVVERISGSRPEGLFQNMAWPECRSAAKIIVNIRDLESA